MCSDPERRLFEATLAYGAAYAAWLTVLMRHRVTLAEHVRVADAKDAALDALHAAYAAYAGREEGTDA